MVLRIVCVSLPPQVAYFPTNSYFSFCILCILCRFFVFGMICIFCNGLASICLFRWFEQDFYCHNDDEWESSFWMLTTDVRQDLPTLIRILFVTGGKVWKAADISAAFQAYHISAAFHTQIYLTLFKLSINAKLKQSNSSSDI